MGWCGDDPFINPRSLYGAVLDSAGLLLWGRMPHSVCRPALRMLCYLQDCHLQPIFGLETAVFGCSFMTYTISILQFVADLFPVLKSTQSTVLTIHHSPGDGKSSPNNTRPSHPRDRNKRQPSVFIGRAHDMIRRWKTQEFLKS